MQGKRLAVFVFLLGVLPVMAKAQGDGLKGRAPVRIGNGRIALAFDAATGAWTGLVDKADGRDLAVGPAEGVPLGLALPRLDVAALEAARKKYNHRKSIKKRKKVSFTRLCNNNNRQ